MTPEARSERAYRRLLRLLPASFRAEAEIELLETFRQAYARVEPAGAMTRVRFWLRMWLDTIVTAAAERLRARPSAHLAERRSGRLGFLSHDLRDARRALVRTPGYTTVVIATLALGTGVNTAIFSVLDAVVFKSLPYADAERLVRVAEWPETGGNYTVAPAAFLNWRTRLQSFAALEARLPRPYTWLDTGDPEELRGALVTPGYFDLLGLRAAEGRTFIATDGEPGQPCRVVITHRLWARRLNADGASIGRPLRLGGLSCTLIGVLPADSVFDRNIHDVFQPMAFDAADSQRQGRVLTVLARLGDGVTLEAARAELVAVAAAFNATRGSAGRAWTAAITPLRDVVVQGDTRRLVWVLIAAVGGVLLIACVNVAGLTLSRTADRRRELSVRAALGASRGRLFRALVVESLVLAVCASVVGLLVGMATLRLFSAQIPPGTLPPEVVPSLDLRTLLFTSGLTVLTGLLVGSLPAWRGAGSSEAAQLASGGRAMSQSRTTARLQNSLLVAEVALAMVLVIGAVLLTVSFARLTRVAPGFDPAGVVTTRLDAPPARYLTDAAVVDLYQRLLGAITARPGVSHAAAITSLPLGGWRFGTTFVVEGTPSDPKRPTSAHIQHVAGPYFEALGIPLAAGRTFTSADGTRAPLVAIVNETFAKRFIPDGPTIGRGLTLGIDALGQPPGASWHIVGVTRDVKTGGLDEGALATPEIYVPHPQSPSSTMFLAVRAMRPDGGSLVPDIRAALRTVDSQLALGSVLTMDERIGASVRTQRFRTSMIGALALLAGLVASIGVYAVRSQTVRSRAREMGIRVALGATASRILGLVLGQTLRLVAVGLLVGLCGALFLTRFVETWLFGTRATDPAIVIASTLILGAAAVVASWGPARRAARIDPVVTMRQEG